MGIAVRPFEPERDLDRAAALLAGRQARDRAREPLLPVRFEEPQACREQVQGALGAAGSFGVIAEVAGKAAGFAVMSPLLFPPTHYMANYFPPRSVTIGYAAHAAKAGLEYDAYREIYAVLAGHFVERGFFDHIVYVAPSDAATSEAWASLAFGRDLTAAIRDVAPPQRQPAAVELHQAAAQDKDVVFRLHDELNLHHTESPIFWPLLREADASNHEFQTDLLADPETNAHWIAYDNGAALGMNTFMAPNWISPLIAPEKTVYLYQGIVSKDAQRGGVGTAVLARGIEWARERGYEHVALHFAAANLPGAKFWQSSGFRPVEHRLRRRIDERIAWAHS